jgi:hypothetical protein
MPGLNMPDIFGDRQSTPACVLSIASNYSVGLSPFASSSGFPNLRDMASSPLSMSSQLSPQWQGNLDSQGSDFDMSYSSNEDSSSSSLAMPPLYARNLSPVLGRNDSDFKSEMYTPGRVSVISNIANATHEQLKQSNYAYNQLYDAFTKAQTEAITFQ